MKMKPIQRRILIADDHELVRRGFRALLESCRDLEVCGEAENGKEAVRQAVQLHPDLVILDVRMPVLDGISAAKQIKQVFPDIPVLMLSMHFGEQIVQSSRLAGVQGFVSKADASKVLMKAVNVLLQGKTFFSRNHR